jgi:hypothetical protein
MSKASRQLEISTLCSFAVWGTENERNSDCTVNIIKISNYKGH